MVEAGIKSQHAHRSRRRAFAIRLKDDKSVCLWHGINCTKGRVTAVVLKQNGLQGALPQDLERLTELETFDVSGGRPSYYQ